MPAVREDERMESLAVCSFIVPVSSNRGIQQFERLFGVAWSCNGARCSDCRIPGRLAGRARGRARRDGKPSPKEQRNPRSPDATMR
jgi:hypothetical protein